ncbi:MAG: transglutaminase domain-containing protein [Candidatus Diapherotrites archaeon]
MRNSIKVGIVSIIILFFVLTAFADMVSVIGPINDVSSCKSSPVAVSLWCMVCNSQCQADDENPKYFSFNYDSNTLKHSCSCTNQPPEETEEEELELNTCFEELVGESQLDGIVIMGSAKDTWSLKKLYDHESEKNTESEFNNDVPAWGQSAISTAWEDTFGGDLIRILLPGVTDPFTYEESATKAFFEKVDAVQGTQIEQIKKIYGLVSEALPNYRSDPEGKECLTFEQALQRKEGICREQAALLKTALQRKGIDAQMAFSSKHAWVRVTIHQPGSACDGWTIDLDPTWYKEFVPLNVRPNNEGA